MIHSAYHRHRGFRGGARPARRAAVLLGLVLCVASACSRRAEPEPAPAAEGLRREFERGPVKVVLSVDRSELTIAERLRLTLEVFADEAYEAQLPRFGEKLESFGIVDYQTLPPELVADNRVRTGRTYLLEPFLSGPYTIPPMTISFVARDDAEAKTYALETEAIDITVTSLLPENLEELAIHDVVDPVELPRSPVPLLWAALLLAGLVLAAGAVWLVQRRRRQRRLAEVRRIPPYELALGELERLVADRLPERGEIKAFYRRISDILRTYIERRFGVRAPEQTTQEFLATIGGATAFPNQYRPLLDAFLKQCDLVKFAELQPASEDIQKTFDSCKSFIVGTRNEPEEAQDTLKKLDY